MANRSLSAANAQRIQMESLSIQRQLKIQSLKGMLLSSLVIAILLATVAYGLYSRKRRKTIEEHNRMEIVINHLTRQIDEIRKSRPR